MPAISVLIKPASGHCNMKCDYCFYADESSKREQQFYGMMSEQTLKQVIRKTMLNAEQMISYAFQGGEPTLIGLDFFREVMRLEEKYNRNHIRVNNAIQTNGMLIDDDWCRFLKENNFLVGLSVDGTENIHNSLRHTQSGEDTYERIAKTAELFDKWQVDYNILTVVTPQIAENISDIYRGYKKRGWDFQQYIACLDPYGEERGKNPYSIRPKQYGQFMNALFDLWYEDFRSTGQAPNIRQFENYIGIAMGYRPEACDMCGTCSIQYMVEADGSVYPCDFYGMDEYRLGNFNENRLTEIDQKRMEIGFIRESKKISKTCLECKYYRFCKGGCRRNRISDGETDTYINYFCEGYKEFFDHCEERIRTWTETFQVSEI